MNRPFQTLSRLKIVNGLLFLAALTMKAPLVFMVCVAGIVVSVLEMRRTSRVAPYVIPLVFYSLAVIFSAGARLFHMLRH